MKENIAIKDGRNIAAYSSILNLIFALIKGYLAMLTGSKAILAETIHSFTDVIGSLAVWTGIVISRKQSPSFPWGLYKVENITALVSAFFIFLAAYELGKGILTSAGSTLSHIDISVITLLAMVIPIFLFARYEKRESMKLNSPSLLADAQNWMADIAPLAVVIAGLVGTALFPYADKIAASIVIIFVVKAGYDIVKDSMKSLLDASVNPDTLNKIREIVQEVKEVDEITTLHARNSGSFIFAHLYLRLSVKRLSEAHRLSELIEEQIKKEIPFVERVVIHYEPERKEFVRYAVPLEEKEGKISEHFGSSPFIALWDSRISNGEIIKKEILENPFLEIERGKGIKLAEFLVKKGSDVLFVKKDFDHKGPEYVFSNAEIEVRITDKETINNLIYNKQFAH